MPAVFAHAVQQLHHAFGRFNVIPKGAVDLGIVKTFECEFLHNSSPVCVIFGRCSIEKGGADAPCDAISS